MIAMAIGITTVVHGCGGDDIIINDNTPGKEEPKPEPQPETPVSPGLAWNVTTLEVVINKAFDNPVLQNDGGVAVTYSSSDPDVVSVSDEGSLKILAVGSATITASSQPTDKYEAQTVSFTIVVSKPQVDDGAGIINFPSAGDPSSEDDISNTTFNRTVTITYSNTGNATVTGDYHCWTKVDGNKVTVNCTEGDEFVVYKLTGNTDNGSFKLYSQNKQAVILDGVSITNPSGAAIDIQSGKRTFISVENSNVLSDGASADYSSGDEDMKAVLFSEGQLVFSGSGTLTVKALNNTGKAGIASDDYLRFLSNPTVKVENGDQAGDGMKGKEYVRISGGTLDLSVSGPRRKGIRSNGHVIVEGGETTINVSGEIIYDEEEKDYKASVGIKADTYFGMTGGMLDITNSGTGGKGIKAGDLDYYKENDNVEESFISGGVLNIKTTGKTSKTVTPKGIKIGNKVGNKSSSGWSFQYKGDFNISGGSINVSTVYGEALEVKGTLKITDGEHCLESDQNDAINSGGDTEISGGFIYAFSKNGDAIDANADLTISGGTVYAVSTQGGPEGSLDAMNEKGYNVRIEPGATVLLYGNVEPGAIFNQPCFKMDVSTRGYNVLLDGDGKEIVAFKAPGNARKMAVSVPGLASAKQGVNVSGGYSKCNECVLFSTSTRGGMNSTLTIYTPLSIFERFDY